MPVSLVFSWTNGGYYFRLIPSADFDEKKTKGILYRVSDGEDDLLYESDGWYSFNVLVSNDGRYLARRGPWPSSSSDPEKTPAIVFYADGVPVRTYYVSDLIANLSKLEYSVSHYSWGGPLRWSDSSSVDHFVVATVEGKTIKFHVRTAEILK